MTLRPLTFAYWPQAWTLYIEHQTTAQATFATEAPCWSEWDWEHLPHSRLVALDPEQGTHGTVLGWAALVPVARPSVYHGIAEVSLYVANAARGRGIGRLLLQKLILESEDHGIWTLQATLFPEHTSQISLYLGEGFREVGRREQLGLLHGVWRDTVLLERRSTRVGLPSGHSRSPSQDVTSVESSGVGSEK